MSVREHSEGRSANCLSLYTIYELDKDKYTFVSGKLLERFLC